MGVYYRSAGGQAPSPNEYVEQWQFNANGTWSFVQSATYIGRASVLVNGVRYDNPIFGHADGTYAVYGPVANPPPDTQVFNAIVYCFLGGTQIATPQGEVSIEALEIGDLVSTADGGVRKILWVGKQMVSTIFGSPGNFPVEISIDALGDNLPRRPLSVSPGHSLLVDGAFPIASALVNGTTVRQLAKEELPETFTYYHIEVEDHALILAEGVPAETFLDAWSRRTFDNWREYVALYGEEERPVPPSELHSRRVLNFEDLPESLRERLGEPLREGARRAA